ncbi:MAG: S9 family peptidase [Bacteroidia bacterium]|nr:MAG: S9 family peptidase [Bacteroidia bacterium]
MLKLLKLIYLLPFFVVSLSFAQKRPISPKDYASWKNISAYQISNDGGLITMEVNPLIGDGYLYIFNQKTQQIDSIFKGKGAKISENNQFIVFKIGAGYDTLRNCELKKIDNEKWPTDSLGIYAVDKDSIIKFPNLLSFEMPENTNTFAFLQKVKKSNEKVENSAKKVRKKKKTTEKTEKFTTKGNILVLYDIEKNVSKTMNNVTDFQISENGEKLAIITHKKNKVDSFYLEVYASNGTILQNFKHSSSFIKPTFSKSSNLFYFSSSNDSTKTKDYQNYLYDFDKKQQVVVSDSSTWKKEENLVVSPDYSPFFSLDEKLLYFGVSPYQKQDPKDSLLESEKVKVDVWHYQDTRIQPQQLKTLKEDLKKSSIYVYHIDDKSNQLIARDSLNFTLLRKRQQLYYLATSNQKYLINQQWTGANHRDFYRLNSENGSYELLKTNFSSDAWLSPNGKYFTWFNTKDLNYYLDKVDGEKNICMTCSEKNVHWEIDLNGQPTEAESYRIIGTSRDENNIFIQSRFDIYKYNVPTKQLSCFTNHLGKEKLLNFQIEFWDNDSLYIEEDAIYLKAFNENTKGNHIYLIKNNELKEVYASEFKIHTIKKAAKSDLVLFRKSSVTIAPDIRITDLTFKNEKVLKQSNPLQDSLNWASVELVKWKTKQGIALEGLLYKPENFDKNKKYPLLIYYYELSADGLHTYYYPKPSPSIIYPTEYASNDYVVFIPDIRYQIGHPAQSAYDCIMSGTDYILKYLPQIDSTKMGLQGQSWGGYQTAQLITMTSRFKAAMAGAPVANMFSAYGGIRWGSGINRQFQYEHQQSRIGKTIWEAPELYIENSPLFHLPKVNTPLLIMHNDEDGAVPWYQGIELFTAMRRLQKPCWMLNYNGDDHNLMKTANRFDLSIRMMQFFNHFLKGEKAASWLEKGIPATEKGKTMAYD